MLADDNLLAGGDLAARLIGDVLDPRSQHGAAMGAGQQLGVAKLVQILADGLWRHLEAHREIVDHHAAGMAGKRQNLLLTGADALHECSVTSKVSDLIRADTTSSRWT